MDMDNSVGLDCGSGGHVVALGGGGQRGENWDNCNRIKKNKKKEAFEMTYIYIIVE